MRVNHDGGFPPLLGVLYLYPSDKIKALQVHGINVAIRDGCDREVYRKEPGLCRRRCSRHDSGFTNFFEDLDEAKLLSSISTVIGILVDESFVYNTYFGPLMRFIYDDIWV